MDRAVARRNVVLSRMLDEGISPNNSSIRHALRRLTLTIRAGDCFLCAVPERNGAPGDVNRYGESAYEDGYRIYTTITPKYSRPHSRRYVITCWTTTCPRLSRPGKCAVESGRIGVGHNKITDTLKALPTYGPLLPAESPAPILRKQRRCWQTGRPSIEYGRCSLGASLPFGYSAGTTPRKVTDVLQTGQQIWVRQVTMHGGWRKCRK